ncbi:hypothetical protein Sru01_56660 [Sphaerisporangium rufum]|uniref:CU044_5270 family protein n=1 Tax=Sphaerisporangium rufum TaxID=1381558 RepID=A0A919V2E9_9ACTN|nr:CU044_5270 family protein [Sphaerisporangium rufum]GII80684.1 hypothetical protein Sru01_56660 [Sphaerisporangium rufum]
MNDLDAVRELYGEPTANPQARLVLRGIRARVVNGRPRRRRPIFRLAVAGLAAAAAAVAAVPVAHSWLGADGRITAGVRSGPDLLREMADRAESAPAGQGRYWHVESLSHRPFNKRLGAAPNRYEVEEAEIAAYWTDREGRAWFAFRDLGARPRTAADREAWARDGSPEKWDKTVEPKLKVKLSTQPDQGHVGQVRGKANDEPDAPDDFVFAGSVATYDEIQGLPAEPRELTAAVRDRTLRSTTRSEYDEHNITSTLAEDLLADLPAPPAVRAAALRALADRSDFQYAGPAADDWGRRGELFRMEAAGGRLREELLIDPATTQVLSSRTESRSEPEGPIVKDNSKTYLKVGWTDVPPAIPAVPEGFWDRIT